MSHKDFFYTKFEIEDYRSYKAYVWSGNKRKKKDKSYFPSFYYTEEDDDLYWEEELQQEREMLIDYIDEYGASYSLTKKILVQVPKSHIGSYTIPEGIIAIHERAFSDCRELSEITMPCSLQWIDSGAFENCSSLNRIALPPKIKIIPNFCFHSCISLKHIDLGQEVTTIEEAAFAGCDSLTDVVFPSSVQIIGNSAFNGCVGLKTITIPENIQQIGDAAFFATSITSVIWNAVYTEDFQEIDKDEYGRKVVRYYWQIFNDDTIKNISFGESVKHIPAYLMHNQAIEELNLPAGIESIGDQAFSFCDNLNIVRIPESLSRIGLDAFACIHSNIIHQFNEDQSSLTESQSVALLLDGIPSKYICRVYFDSLVSWCKTKLDSKDSNPLSSLGHFGAAYIDGREANTITINEGIEVINDYCFAGWDTINKVNLHSAVQRIGKYTFYKCKNLKTINFNGDVNEVELSAFNMCENIQLNNEFEHFKCTLFSVEDSPRYDKRKVYEPSDKMTFGKYMHKSISTVIDKDVNYILWCLHHLYKFVLSDDSLKLLLSKHPSKWRALSVYAKFDIAPYELNSPYRELHTFQE